MAYHTAGHCAGPSPYPSLDHVLAFYLLGLVLCHALAVTLIFRCVSSSSVLRRRLDGRATYEAQGTKQ